MKEIIMSLWLTLFGYSVATTRTTTTTYEDVRKAIIREFKEECPIALGVFRSESGLRFSAVGDSGKSIGVAQIHIPSHKKKIPVENKTEWLMNFQNNIKLAKQIRDKSGWNAWTQYKNGAYKQFVDYSCLKEI